MTDYFVLTPFCPMTKEEFCEKKEQLAKEGRKVMAVVWDCKDYRDFERKYFGSPTGWQEVR